MGAKQIIELVLQKASNEQDEEDDKKEEEAIHHSTAKDAFEIALKYLEEQSTASSLDFLWAKKCCDAAPKSRFKKFKKKI